ncbi:MAG TPA: undecaprenyl diphosphate synthase family protein [Candidatus Nanoarchaeia archaeon]|nr:undecaprenyl diphosphate synthase family protein [Candidatus Nanoarchaeia archaeon]
MAGRIPQHIGLTIGKHSDYCSQHRISDEHKYKLMFFKMLDILALQAKYGISIISVHALTIKVKESDNYSIVMDALVEFFTALRASPILARSKVKVSILGKWYDFPGRVVEPIKTVLQETKDNDRLFFNICLNYDGQEEIVDACSLISRKVQAGKLAIESISKETIKDSIYSSYFLPPDILISTGNERSTNGFLLWDSTQCQVYFCARHWMEFGEKEIVEAMKEWQGRI